MSASPRLLALYGAGQRRPLYSRAPSLYFGAPSALRGLARRLAGGLGGRRDELLARYRDRLRALPSADGRPVPLLLTHDVDTAAGYASLAALLDTEEALALASLTLMVTHRYRWDRASLVARAARGHAFGVHDTTHDNRLAYLPVDGIAARIRRAQQALGDLDCGAFRAPAFLRSEALYRGIEGLVSVDLSSPDWALRWPHPGDGVGTPFPLRHGRTLCVPTTMPRDGEIVSLGLDDTEAQRLCRDKATELWRVGAPVVLLTHPDPGFTDTPARVARYATLLSWFRDSGRFAIVPPRDCLAALQRSPAVESLR